MQPGGGSPPTKRARLDSNPSGKQDGLRFSKILGERRLNKGLIKVTSSSPSLSLVSFPNYFSSYSEVLIKALLVNLLYTFICAYAALPPNPNKP